MKIRVYFPTHPFPAQDGSSWVTAEQVAALCARGHSVELITWVRPARKPGPSPLGMLWSPLHDQVTQQASRPRRLAQSLRTGQAMPELAHYPLDLRRALARLGGAADVGIYNYSFCAHLVLDQPKRESRTIVHFHNWEFELAALRAEHGRALERWIHKRNARLLERAETALLRTPKADQVWFVSPSDLERGLALGLPRQKAALVSPTFSPALAQARAFKPTQGSPDTGRFGFIGRLDFEPNLRSAEWMVQRLAPELRAQNFSGEIHLVGRDPPPHLIAAAKSYPFFHFHGFVDDLDPLWQSWTGFLVPDQGGSGVRVKLLEAIASKVPVIANSGALDRAPSALRDLPTVFGRETATEWATELTRRDWIALREKAAAAPFPEVLEGKRLYSALGF